MSASKDLEAWVAEQHNWQLIKKTDKPYYSHLTAVAEVAGDKERLGWEIGLCHDLLEDTDITPKGLRQALLGFGYSKRDADLVTLCVIELTDFFTSAAYPNLGKPERKSLEVARLLTISPLAQTVKYADLLDNIKWVLRYDKKNASQYLKKKRKLLLRLDQGNPMLRNHVMELIEKGLKEL
ncbi:hypothetical protein [Pedobacter mucosus]|uniref:hypothetical protein n=1 Tax=Pedobacter mucosus TaxID=2895286 RepID=UPI001EE43EFD|nr:hypothetical protein [Pedobacter mucosus]UKT65603.1 hypothetical protein LOK61_07380 [Pedobacter mucosus]